MGGELWRRERRPGTRVSGQRPHPGVSAAEAPARRLAAQTTSAASYPTTKTAAGVSEGLSAKDGHSHHRQQSRIAPHRLSSHRRANPKLAASAPKLASRACVYVIAERSRPRRSGSPHSGTILHEGERLRVT
jgi:hypothetical protein